MDGDGCTHSPMRVKRMLLSLNDGRLRIDLRPPLSIRPIAVKLKAAARGVVRRQRILVVHHLFTCVCLVRNRRVETATVRVKCHVVRDRGSELPAVPGVRDGVGTRNAVPSARTILNVADQTALRIPVNIAFTIGRIPKVIHRGCRVRDKSCPQAPHGSGNDERRKTVAILKNQFGQSAEASGKTNLGKG